MGREGGYTITKVVSQKGGELIDLQIRHRIKEGLIATTESSFKSGKIALEVLSYLDLKKQTRPI